MSNCTNDNGLQNSECSEPQNRRKRRRTIQSVDLQHQISPNHKTPNVDYFFTKLDDALSRIESLIPSLQQMVCSSPTNRDSRVGVSTLFDRPTLNPPPHLSNTLGAFEECKCSIDCKQINEMLRKCNMISSRTTIVKPSLSPTSLFSNLEPEKNLPGQRNQISDVRAGMDRVEAVECTLCKNDLVKSRVPDHIQGLQINNDDMNRFQMMCKESNMKNIGLRPQGRDPFLGSVNIVRPKRLSSLCHSDYELSQCLTKGSTSLEKSRSSKRISFRDRDHRSKKIMVPSDSYSSSSETYRSTSSESDGSYESEVQSRQIEASDYSTLGYDTSSYYKSQNSYSDVVSSSQSRSSWSQDNDLKRNKRGGRFKRFTKKLGMIFHHHHHHHHHHYRRRDDESYGGFGGSFWKHIGKMFHHKRKSDGEKPKSDKSRKSVIKSGSNQKQGHFGGLVQALMKHMRHSKKSKKVKDDFVRHGNWENKRKVNKLPWLPKIHKGKGGLKVHNKGKLKLKNRKKRFPLTAAKMILQER